jgi:hypothetical protein
MVTLTDVFDFYRDHAKRPRQHRRGPKVWHNSPLHEIRDFTRFNGKLMAEIPSRERLRGINPHVIDKLQGIWARPHINSDQHVELVDALQFNLTAPPRLRYIHGDNHLIQFKGDPNDGSPRNAAP